MARSSTSPWTALREAVARVIADNSAAGREFRAPLRGTRAFDRFASVILAVDEHVRERGARSASVPLAGLFGTTRQTGSRWVGEARRHLAEHPEYRDPVG